MMKVKKSIIEEVNLIKLCKENNATIKELNAKLGYTSFFIYEVSNGKKVISEELFNKILTALKELNQEWLKKQKKKKQ